MNYLYNRRMAVSCEPHVRVKPDWRLRDTTGDGIFDRVERRPEFDSYQNG